MKLIINGKPEEHEVQSVAELLKALKLDQAAVAVELNRDVVPKSQHASTQLSEGDSLELVTLVGGG